MSSSSVIRGSTGVIIRGPNQLEHGTIPFNGLGEEDVIVKVHSAPINPSDEMLCAGVYPAGKIHPCTAGLEGSGIVVAAGPNPQAQSLIGKRVSFFSVDPKYGTWSDYCLTHFKMCFPLLDPIDYEQGACALINPLTVEAMMLECDEKGYKAIVHSGASSQLGRMMVKIAPRHRVTVINLVRREENVKLLKDLGATIVVDTAVEGWEAVFADLVEQHQPQAFFDCVCGEVGSKIVAALPPNSTTYGYGALGGLNYSVSIGDLAFQSKTVRGFWLNTEIANPARAIAAATAMITNLVMGVYKTEVVKRFPTTQYAEAMKFAKENMSAGKVLLQNPNF